MSFLRIDRNWHSCAAALAFSFAALVLQPAVAQRPAQNDSENGPETKMSAYEQIVRADQPTAYWRFDGGTGATELDGNAWKPAQIVGPIAFNQAAPRAERFPLFDEQNAAA